MQRAEQIGIRSGDDMEEQLGQNYLTAGPFGVRRIDALFGIEQEISGLGAEQQVAV